MYQCANRLAPYSQDDIRPWSFSTLRKSLACSYQLSIIRARSVTCVTTIGAIELPTPYGVNSGPKLPRLRVPYAICASYGESYLERRVLKGIDQML